MGPHRFENCVTICECCGGEQSLRRGKIVAIIGIDGAGKTSLSRRLEKELVINDCEPLYVYARFTPILSRPLVRMAQALLGTRAAQNPKVRIVEREAKRRFVAKPFVSVVMIAVFMIDYWIQLVPKVWLPYLRGNLVICDRYIHDTVLSDIGPDLGWSPDTAVRGIAMLSNLAPKADLLIFLSVSLENALSRKSDIPSRNHIEERRNLYEEVARKLGAAKVDGNGDFDTVYKQTIEIIKTELIH